MFRRNGNARFHGTGKEPDAHLLYAGRFPARIACYPAPNESAAEDKELRAMTIVVMDKLQQMTDKQFDKLLLNLDPEFS